MTSQQEKAERFLALHHGDAPLLMPNPWDIGSARILESLGFQALATTSSGFAGTLGRLDGQVTRDEALAHAADVAGAVGVPVSADLENAFADEPEGVSATIAGAIAAGLAGCSVEDYSRERGLYAPDLAAERVAAAAETAHSGAVHLVLTARAENHIRGNPDLDDTIARLRAFEEAGADVLYAPGLRTVEEIRAVCEAVSKPVNVLARADLSLAEMVAAGAQRVSVGGALTWVAVRAMVDAAEAIRDRGDFSALNVKLQIREWFA
jgi:2-methylisocitrate lyase-like PEP mutase family enzyme